MRLVFASIVAFAAFLYWRNSQAAVESTSISTEAPIDSPEMPVESSALESEPLIEQVLDMVAKFTVPQKYAGSITNAETQYGLPSGLLARVLRRESHYREDIITGKVRSKVGALGIAQFMPATAAELGVDPLDPFDAIDGAARYLARLYKITGTWPEAVAAYNWGVGNVQRKGLAAAPKETTDYLAEVFS